MYAPFNLYILCWSYGISTVHLNNSRPVLLAVCRLGVLHGRSNIDTAVDVEAKGVAVADVADLLGQDLPVEERKSASVHVLSVGGKLILLAVPCAIDSPFLDKDELAVGLLQPAVVAVGPLVGVAGFGASVAVDYQSLVPDIGPCGYQKEVCLPETMSTLGQVVAPAAKVQSLLISPPKPPVAILMGLVAPRMPRMVLERSQTQLEALLYLHSSVLELKGSFSISKAMIVDDQSFQTLPEYLPL